MEGTRGHVSTALAPALKPLLSGLGPQALAQVQASARPAVACQLSPITAPLPATASRAGGQGYWPAAQPWPRTPAGKPLALLAQINLADLPAGAAAQLQLPGQGLLAFYISTDGNDFLGDHAQCLYWPDTSAPSLSAAQQLALQQTRTTEWDTPFQHPVQGEYALRLAPAQPHVLLHPCQAFEAHYGQSAWDWAQTHQLPDTFFDQLRDSQAQPTTHLGGHPFLPDDQAEPPELAQYPLLFQLDSAGHASDVQVDCACQGTLGFYLRPADWQAQRFDRALCACNTLL